MYILESFITTTHIVQPAVYTWLIHYHNTHCAACCIYLAHSLPQHTLCRLLYVHTTHVVQAVVYTCATFISIVQAAVSPESFIRTTRTHCAGCCMYHPSHSLRQHAHVVQVCCISPAKLANNKGNRPQARAVVHPVLQRKGIGPVQVRLVQKTARESG